MMKTICYCSQISEEQLISAIVNQSASTLDDIRALTGACTISNCKVLSPLKRCCSPEIKKLLDANK